MNRKLLLVWSALFFLSLTVYSQDVGLDSIKHVWKNSPTDTVRLEALLTIVKKQFPVQLDSVIQYAIIGSKESQQLKRKDYEGKFLFYQGMAHRRSKNFNEAIRVCKRSMEASVLAKQWEWAAGAEREIGDSYIAKVQYDSALWHLFHALELDKNTKENYGTGNLANTIAYVYELMEDPKQSISWLNRSLDIAARNNFKVLVYKAYFDLGNVYDLMKKYDSALLFKIKSLQLTPKSENDYLILHGNIANTYMELGNLDSALVYMQRFDKLTTSTDYSPHMVEKMKARGMVNFGRIYFLKSDYRTAETYLLNALIASKKARDEHLVIESYFNLSNVYEATNKTAEAFKYYRLYESKTDSIYNLDKQRVIQDMTTKYETEKKEQQIKLLQAEASARQQWTIALISILTLIVTIVIFLLMRRNLKMKAQMAEEKKKVQQDRFKMVLDTEEKERKRIARELHDGIGQMLTTSRLLISDLEETHGDAKATRALQVLDTSIKELRNISHNMMPIKLTELGLTEAIRDMVSTLNATEKISAALQLDGFIQLSEMVSIPIYRSVQEIVNNAIKYSEASKLEIALTQSPEKLVVVVSDNGKGFNSDNIHASKGLGWNSIHARMELIGGSVNVYSKANEGTKVKLVIPNQHSENAALSA